MFDQSAQAERVTTPNLPAVIDPQADLPALLRRPAVVGAPMARLSYHLPERKQIAEAKAARRAEPPPRWRLTGAPTVLIMAKRMFGSAGVAEGVGLISFPAHPAEFENLLMLQHRFPIEVTRSAQATWEALYTELVDEWLIRSGQLEIGKSIGGGIFNGVLEPFQNEGVRWMAAGRKSLLADDTGLGKTVEFLALAAKVDEWPIVIVCQPHVIPHWRTKIPQFLDVEEAPGTRSGKRTWTWLEGEKPKGGDVPKADIYLLHYLVAHAWVDYFKAQRIKMVGFDEVQELRHTGTRKHEACRQLCRTSPRVAGLSATPIYNRGPEIYNVLDTINRGCLGTFEAFKLQWCEWDAAGKLVVKDPDLLGQYLRERNLMLRRTKKEVMKDLPPKRRVVEPIDANNKVFAELVREAVRLAKEAVYVRDPFERGQIEARAISQARLATGVAKAPAVSAFVRGLLEAEEPTLLFAHHHAVYHIIMNELDAFDPVAITGQQTISVKQRSQEAFMRGDTNLCLISLRAATGLDGLEKRARIVVFGELDWSPAVHKQAEDRADARDPTRNILIEGARRSILAYYLVTDVGTDPFIMQTLGIKESQSSGILHDAPPTEAELREAAAAAEKHKASILATLRAHR